MASSSCEILAPPGTDLDVFRCLPPEMQREVVEDYKKHGTQNDGIHSQRQNEPHTDRDARSRRIENLNDMSSGPSQQESNKIDQEFLDALPKELQLEVIQQQRAQTIRSNTKHFSQQVDTPPSPERTTRTIPTAKVIPARNIRRQREEICSNGMTYSGEYNSYGERHGRGILRWPNGDRYDGQFVNGMREGEGTLYSDRGSEYVGQWKRNRMHGYGVRHFASGTSYHGEYVNGLRHGTGKTIFPNGDVYEGEYYNDKMDGHGKYLHSKVGECYEGTFRNGKKHGVGKYQMRDGSLDVVQYKEDKRVGEGVRYSKNRRRSWKLIMNGQKQGKRVSLEEAHVIAERCTKEASLKDDIIMKKRSAMI